ncbi:MAG: dipeptide ABC transporter ATP-binding protein [Clostridiales bacterium]
MGYVKAVNGVSFSVRKGETLGIVGESGCGKSTTGRALLRLLEPTSGSAIFDGVNIFDLPKNQLCALRRSMQIIFQDPYASLNPRMTVGKLIEEPMKLHHMYTSEERKNKTNELLEKVGMNVYHSGKYPHEFSGGQRQRIGIARALAMNPKFVICDEPVSALDVSIQSQVLNLLQDLQQEYDLTYLFISHDLSVVKHISDRVGVMYLGYLVEMTDVEELYANPVHPYTQSLLSSIPEPNPHKKNQRIHLEGEVPNPINMPSGCCFHTRCRYCMDICKKDVPEFKDIGNGHLVACHLHQQ